MQAIRHIASLLAVLSLPVLWLAVLGLAPVNAATAPTRIAFLPDVHFHDVYGVLPDVAPAGVHAPGLPAPVLIRTMAAQLKSTRLFNENYFAFIAALDDLARRQVKLVVLPGDFSDDGQLLHIRGLKQLLRQYQRQHGMRFLLTFGNHDPVRPVSRPGGKADFLAANGQPLAIYSPGSTACPATAAATPKPGLICSEGLRELGYAELFSELGEFGLLPGAADLFWESPFGDASSAALTNRQYDICAPQDGAAAATAAAADCQRLPDASYLLEPVPGLWLLALDANVYVPEPGGREFHGSGNAGYNAVVQYKPHLLSWIKTVVARAKAQQKTLVSFSHFPMAEFYQGQGAAIAALLGPSAGQLSRLPTASTSQTLANLGLPLHIGGHMHLNNTSVTRTSAGHQLVNVQAPSIAAYRPAYKLLTIEAPQQVRLETIELDQVPGFDRLFALYQREHQALAQQQAPGLWDKQLLQARSYHQFSLGHLHALTRQRFLPNDWPADLRTLLLALNAQQMLILSALDHPLTLAQFRAAPEVLHRLQQSRQWLQVQQQLQHKASAAGIGWAELAGWDGLTLAQDFYALQNAGALALADIGPARLAQYRFFSGMLQARATPDHSDWASQPLSHYAASQFAQLGGIVDAFIRAPGYDHFRLNLQTGQLQPLR